MRVARVIAVLERGGAQLGALRLSLALRAHGIRSRWLAGHATREGLALFRAHGVEVEVLGGGPALQYARRRAFAERLGEALLDEDVVHAHMFGAWWAAAHVVPEQMCLVASEHNALQWPGRVPTRALHEALARVDLFFAHGPAARGEILAAGFPAERMREGISPVVGAAVSPVRGLPSPRIVFAGRLHHEKGPDLLLDALARLAEPPPVLLLGAGVMERELRRRAARLGIDERVHFEGWRDDPAAWIAGASVCVVPSRFDAWSQTAALAMSLGVPVVATAVEGLPGVLGDGRGVLVAPEDPAALSPWPGVRGRRGRWRSSCPPRRPPSSPFHRGACRGRGNRSLRTKDPRRRAPPEAERSGEETPRAASSR
jgi:glycosyltransferase involved in cell wall biosynthesis